MPRLQNHFTRSLCGDAGAPPCLLNLTNCKSAGAARLRAVPGASIGTSYWHWRLPQGSHLVCAFCRQCLRRTQTQRRRVADAVLVIEMEHWSMTATLPLPFFPVFWPYLGRSCRLGINCRGSEVFAVLYADLIPPLLRVSLPCVGVHPQPGRHAARMNHLIWTLRLHCLGRGTNAKATCSKRCLGQRDRGNEPCLRSYSVPSPDVPSSPLPLMPSCQSWLRQWLRRIDRPSSLTTSVFHPRTAPGSQVYRSKGVMSRYGCSVV